MREALFCAVESWCGSLQGLRFLDLYAGSGAVGLEAWSRGAGVVSLVESDRRTARLICDNAKLLGFSRPRGDRHGRGDPVPAPSAPYDVVFMDPPYELEEDEVAKELALVSGGWLVPGALVVVERASRSPEPASRRASTEAARGYGETTLWYGHAAANQEDPQETHEHVP